MTAFVCFIPSLLANSIIELCKILSTHKFFYYQAELFFSSNALTQVFASAMHFTKSRK